MDPSDIAVKIWEQFGPVAGLGWGVSIWLGWKWDRAERRADRATDELKQAWLASSRQSDQERSEMLEISRTLNRIEGRLAARLGGEC